MGGISQCPACGDLNYGDERDDYQTCACHTGATVMSDQERVTLELTREQADDLLSGLEEDVNKHAWTADVSLVESGRQKHANIAATYTAIAAQLKEQTNEQ